MCDPTGQEEAGTRQEAEGRKEGKRLMLFFKGVLLSSFADDTASAASFPLFLVSSLLPPSSFWQVSPSWPNRTFLFKKAEGGMQSCKHLSPCLP